MQKILQIVLKYALKVHFSMKSYGILLILWNFINFMEFFRSKLKILMWKHWVCFGRGRA